MPLIYQTCSTGDNLECWFASMVKSCNVAKKFGHKPCVRVCTNPNTLGFMRDKRAIQSLNAPCKKSNHTQVIINNKVAKNYVAALDTGAQNFMIGMGVW